MREMGGYLELELAKGKEYYEGPGVVAVDTGRTAIYCALADCKATKVYLPYYLCTSMLQVPQYLGIPYEFYAIDEDFMPPEGLQVGDTEAFLYINYFGTADLGQIRVLARRYRYLLIDNTQAFFSAPLAVDDQPKYCSKAGDEKQASDHRIYHLYSARKFFGVSDGGYVIEPGIRDFSLDRDISYPHALHLLKRIEQGAQAAYRDNLANEMRFDCFRPKAMSYLSQRILQGVDYERVQNQRQHNFRVLHQALGSINRLSLDHDFAPPMVYPLLIRQSGLREYLVANRIYIPHWWKDVLHRVRPDSYEALLSNCLIPLPIDQRYEEEDMRGLAKLVQGYRKVDIY